MDIFDIADMFKKFVIDCKHYDYIENKLYDNVINSNFDIIYIHNSNNLLYFILNKYKISIAVNDQYMFYSFISDSYNSNVVIRDDFFFDVTKSELCIIKKSLKLIIKKNIEFFDKLYSYFIFFKDMTTKVKENFTLKSKYGNNSTIKFNLCENFYYIAYNDEFKEKSKNG